MIFSIILFILFSFFSYRLIGIRTTVSKVLMSSIFSLFFSSVAYYALHLSKNSSANNLTQFDHYTFLYFITLVVVSMGFSLLLEMMHTTNRTNEIDQSVNVLDKIKYFFATKLRYINLFINISRNGLLKSSFQSNKDARNEQLSIALKSTLEQAGGIFVKFGQFLSTQSDIFPKAFREELSTLQDKVSPIPIESIKQIIHAQFEQPLEEIFDNFDEEPIAAASIAQVHKATLHSGDKVIVKILRPTLRKQLAIDIKILASFSELIANKTTWGNRVGITNLTEGFIQNLYEEIDFSIELNNMQQMRKQSSPEVYIPKAFPEHSTSEVLVMEFLEGVSINKMDDVINDASKIQKINTIIFQEMLTDIFDRGFFHGDPHPGNIFLLKNGKPAFIDFGSVGRLSAIQRNGFKWLLIGIHRENAETMVNGVKGLIENSEDINSKQLEQTLSQFLTEHNFDGNVLDDMGKELFEIMSHFGFKFFPDVAGAFRSLITLQGSLQSIDADFNLTTMIDNYLKNQINRKKLTDMALENLEDDVLNLIPKVRSLPNKVDNIFQKIETGKITVRTSHFADEDNVRYVNSVLALFFTGLTGFGIGILALGALFLAQTEDPGGYSFLNIFGYSGLGLSVIMLIRVAIHSLTRKQ